MRFSRLAVVVLLLGVFCRIGGAQPPVEMHLKVTAGTAGQDVPVCAVIDLPAALRDVPAGDILGFLSHGNRRQSGQVIKNDGGKAELWWIVPKIEAGASTTWTARLVNRRWMSRAPQSSLFSFTDTRGQYLDLFCAGQHVTRYMYAHDSSTPERRFETYKPFHHVYDGDRRLTNGPDGESEYIAENIRYPHHRGVFIGWNHVKFSGQDYDLWHMSGVEQVHQQFLTQAAGPVLARTTSLIYWNDKEAQPILVERRSVTVYRQADPTVTLLDFHTELTAPRGDAELDGDPEHAGMQYRPHNDVAAGGPEVKAKYLFHQEGINPREDPDLPWVAMSYGLGGQRYCVEHMNHPDNPKDSIYSAYRDYGRFGAFPKTTVKKGETLTLRYRIWVGQGDLSGREAPAARYATFVAPPEVKVLKR